jgi:beta-lactamase regulating signal transducer with metallopeptidase domain
MLRWFAETTLVAAALAAVAALAPRLRTLGPAARHALWLVVLVKLMTPPLVHWPWPVVTPAVMGFGMGAHSMVEAPAAAAVVDERFDEEPSANAVPKTAASAPAAPGGWIEALRGVDPAELSRWALGAWLAVTAGLVAGLAVRIVKFRRKLGHAVPAPGWLVEEAELIARRMGVRVPEALVVPGLGVPMLWCLGRSKLLLPAHLVGSLGVERWRGVLAHELAHLRRGDPWVGRLELVAGLLWWWNPVYRLARRRLDTEAELACDAWVVWTLPRDRLVYAETMLAICASLATSPAKPPAPTLGVTGAGRFFERRLTMILRDQVPCRLSLPGLLGTGLLVLLASPSWSVAEAPAPSSETASTFALSTATFLDGPADDDDDPEDVAKAKAEAERAVREAERAAREAERAQRRAKQAAERAAAKRSADKAATKGGDAKTRESNPGDVERARAEAAKRLEEAARKQKELSERFGPEFEKKMEEMGRKIEKEMTAKFGPGSEFEKKMEKMGKKIEEKFGPGSEFEKKMKELGTRIQKDLGPELEKAMKSFDFDLEKKGKARSARPSPEPAPKPSTGDRSRAARINEIESRINQLMDELKRLKASGDGESVDEKPR